MDIVQLKTLIHVAELGSLSKAAERLHIAQPALSRQVRMLEKELGVYLFERHGRGMLITEPGLEVLSHAKRILAEMESIHASVGGGSAAFRGSVMIGATPTIAEIITVPLMRRIREAHPELTVRFSSAFSGHLLDWQQRGELEMTITYDTQPLHSLRTIPVMMETLMLVGSISESLSVTTPVHFASLAEKELVLPSARHGLRKILNQCAQEAGVALKTSVEVDSLGAMIDLVREGFGCTILPLASVYARLNAGQVSIAPLVEPTPMRKLVLVYPADRPISPAARFVGDTFLEVAADLVERDIWAGHML